jgi:Cu(I)/Ag(I) efflux system membrane protein CusA/SilA
VLLIVGAGLFPLDAITGLSWHAAFLLVVAVTIFATTIFIVGRFWQLASLVSLMALSLWAYNLSKIGTDYMPVLDEGSILDMPVTVPRASVTEVARDLKARNALLRAFPEVESIVGKAGRADTPTDPSPLEMVETVINLRPKPFWPKRKMNYASDAVRQASVVLAAMERQGLLRQLKTEADRKSLVEPATMTAVTRLDATTRQLAMERYREFDLELGPRLVQDFAAELVRRWQGFGRLKRPVPEAEIARVAAGQDAKFASILASGANQEDITRLIQQIADRLAAAGYVQINPELLAIERNSLQQAWDTLGGAMGLEAPTFFTSMYEFIQNRRDAQWRAMTKKLDYEIFDHTVGAYNWYCLEEIRNEARKQGLWKKRPLENSPLLSGEGQGGRGHSDSAATMAHTSSETSLTPALSRRERETGNDPGAEQETLKALRAELDGPFAKGLFLWQKTKPDIVQEMDSAVQVPGWGNIWTQPIINRIDMLATGVRTMIGVKVFGDDLDKIQGVSQQVATVLRQVPGAVDVFPDQDVGKGYLEINIDRQKAARYGVNVGDIQDVIEVALGGKEITQTVEGRQRFPVRVRYGRAWREDEEQVKNLLVNASGPMASGAAEAMGSTSGGAGKPAAAAGPGKPVQIPLSSVAEIKIVEGPAMIKSENGMLRSYVQLNVRDRDVVGFVEEAQRIVAQKVSLPQGMYLQWSGEFESQVRARKTMQVVFPAALLLIFVILYLTYNDFVDAVLMMMAVPEALVGGVLFLRLFGPYFTPPVHYSVAVQVGFIACFGMATETGIIMLVYLREAIEKRGGLEKIGSLDELRQAVIEGAVHRLRPKLLTEGVAIIALAPMLWSSGVGHEIISAMAAPVLGGLLIADEVVDMFIPVRFYWVRRYRWLKMHGGDAGASAAKETKALVDAKALVEAKA